HITDQTILTVTHMVKIFQYNDLSQAILSCPKCNAAMEPMLLAMNDDGTQSVWWTCSEVKTKKCFFPLNMPNDVFWVTRSAQDIEKDEVPPPNLANLPIRYQYLYPSFFQRYTSSKRKTPRGSRPGSRAGSRQESRQGSHESTRSASVESSHSVTVPDSIWDDGDIAKSRVRMNTIAKPRVVMTEKRSFIPPSLNNVGNRALAFTESYREDTASTSIASRLRLGNADKKMDKAARELAKKKAIAMLSGVQPANFKKMGALHINEMKKAVIEHVKRRRAEREQLAELKKLSERRNKFIDIDDLVKAKLLKNKREYEQIRQKKAHEARMAAARMSKTAMSQPSIPAMPGYEDDGYEEEINPTDDASYAVTPPYMSGATSPSTSSFNQYEGQFPQEYNCGGEDSFADPSSSSGMDWVMDHSLHIPPYENDESNVVSPFAELGHLDEDDLMGIEGDQQFDRAFEAVAEAFTNEYEDEFADLAQYN
ncbi:hypothetical protein PRIPAC_85284, partial [Pristionchus pacificus]|uniref:Uncharacterized protein n=1 Tax=Pristionchus pacificus TaxID=54126 RepID=A0A8R1Z7T9_PRIPA